MLVLAFARDRSAAPHSRRAQICTRVLTLPVLDAVKVWGAVIPVTSAKLLHGQQASTLSLFLVLRLAEIKVQRIGIQVEGAKGLFHGKLYVVERGRAQDADHDTVALMGSPNWSESALFGGTDRGNTEIAAIYRLPGWVAPSANRLSTCRYGNLPRCPKPPSCLLRTGQWPNPPPRWAYCLDASAPANGMASPSIAAPGAGRRPSLEDDALDRRSGARDGRARREPERLWRRPEQP